jgi:hypothetical protein
MSLPKLEQGKVIQIGERTLKVLLTFKLEVDIQRYLGNRHSINWSDLEHEIAVNQSLHGAGIVATPEELLHEPDFGEEGFFRSQVPLSSEEVGHRILSFPIEAAAASYAFTLLEVFGNDVAAVTSPKGLNRNKAWHEDIKGFADLRDKVQVEAARRAFGKHFLAQAGDVPEIAARRMVELKRVRNDFAHDGNTVISFDNFLQNVLAIICHIIFLVTDEKRLLVYPFEDHHRIFKPST